RTDAGGMAGHAGLLEDHLRRVFGDRRLVEIGKLAIGARLGTFCTGPAGRQGKHRAHSEKAQRRMRVQADHAKFLCWGITWAWMPRPSASVAPRRILMPACCAAT